MLHRIDQIPRHSLDQLVILAMLSRKKHYGLSVRMNIDGIGTIMKVLGRAIFQKKVVSVEPRAPIVGLLELNRLA